MTSFRRGRAKLVTFSIWLALVACATPPFSETSATDGESPSTSLPQEDPGPSEEGNGTTIPWSPFLCDLVTVIGDQQGSVVGTFVNLKPGLSGLPWDQPDREYAEASVKVEQVVGYRPISDAGTNMPPIVVGDELPVVVYPDNAGTPVEELAGYADAHANGLFVLVALDFPPDLTVEGRWSLKRFAADTNGQIAFPGFCEEDLGQQLEMFAKNVSQASDLGLVTALSAEMLAKYNQPDVVGPLEEAFREANS